MTLVGVVRVLDNFTIFMTSFYSTIANCTSHHPPICPTPREPGRSRNDYLSSLKKDLATYYGYNAFMVDYILNLFPVAEAIEVRRVTRVWVCILV